MSTGRFIAEASLVLVAAVAVAAGVQDGWIRYDGQTLQIGPPQAMSPFVSRWPPSNWGKTPLPVPIPVPVYVKREDISCS